MRAFLKNAALSLFAGAAVASFTGHPDVAAVNQCVGIIGLIWSLPPSLWASRP